jgi:hypothetical protein
VVLDGDFEVNLLPNPGTSQRAANVGMTILL